MGIRGDEPRFTPDSALYSVPFRFAAGDTEVEGDEAAASKISI